MITNKISQIAAPEDTHHSAAQLFLETITISKSCSIVITFGSHQAFFGWYIYTHLYCMDQGQIAGCPPFRPLSLHFDRSIYINNLNTQQPGIAFIFLNFIFFYHFNSYLLITICQPLWFLGLQIQIRNSPWIKRLKDHLRRCEERMGLPRWCSGKDSACQCRRGKRHGFSPWVGKIPWRR